MPDEIVRLRQIAAVNAGLYRSAETDLHALRNQIAKDIQAACTHDPNPEKFDVCVACADAVNVVWASSPDATDDIPVIVDGTDHIGGLRLQTAHASPAPAQTPVAGTSAGEAL